MLDSSVRLVSQLDDGGWQQMFGKKTSARTAFREFMRFTPPPKADGANVRPPRKIADADAVVWLIGALVNSRRQGLFAPVPHDLRKAQPPAMPDHIGQAARASAYGQEVPEDWLPRRWWLPASVGLKGPLPPVLGNGWLVMHRSVADIFRSFDLGECRIVPVELVDGDHATVLSDEYDLFHVCNRRPTLDLERSTSVFMPDPNAAPDLRMFHNETRDEPRQPLADPAAARGPALWMDPRVYRALFLAPALVEALKTAKRALHFSLMPCAASTG